MEGSEQKGTRYLVLRYVEGDQEGVAGHWDAVGEVVASNDKQAIERVAEGAGTFVAVPMRSFRPRTRKVQTVERTLWE